MKKQIVVDLKTSAFLRDAFGCTRQAVWNALTFESNSDQAKKIRHLAIQKGGELVGASVEPETSHESDGTMTQAFGKRVKLTYPDDAAEGFKAYLDKVRAMYE